MTPKRIREVERLARTWAEIANDDEAAPWAPCEGLCSNC